MARSGSWRLVALLIAVGSLTVAATQLPIDRWAIELITAVRGLGALGWIAFVAVYIAVTATLLPASVLTLGAGFAYGLPGVLLVWPAAVIGSTLAFAIGRRFARAFVAEKLDGTTRFRAIDEVVGDSGFKITALLRLSPLIPFGLLNYGLSLTRIRASDYVVATSLGIVPGTFMYVYLGSSVGNLAALADDSATDSVATRVAFWVGLAITVAVTVWITRLARRRISEIIGSDPGVPQNVEGAEHEDPSGGDEAGEMADVAHLKRQGDRGDRPGDEHRSDLE